MSKTPTGHAAGFNRWLAVIDAGFTLISVDGVGPAAGAALPHKELFIRADESASSNFAATARLLVPEFRSKRVSRIT